MAVPPCYADLGKSARDAFSKGFNYGFYKLECKTKTASGVEFTTTGNSNHESGNVLGNLETKYSWADYGLTFTEKWDTENTLGTEIKIEDQLAKGLKLAFDTQFAPQTGKKSGKIKTAYKQDYVNVNCDVDFDFAGPTVHGAAVAGYNGWLVGYQMCFDTAKSQLQKNNFSVGFAAEDFTIHTNVDGQTDPDPESNDGTEFGGSYHQKITSDLETAVQLSWTAGSNATRFGLATKYTPDADTVLRAKINNASQIGLSYQQKIREGTTITLSALLEGKSLNQGGHKVGLGLDLAA